MGCLALPGVLNVVQVSVLAKVPLPGQVKTRLGPALGAAGAASLHEAMAADVQQQLHRAGVTPDWHVAGPLDHPWVSTLAGPVHAQVPGDLGARVQAALGRGPRLALGIDAPTLPRSLLGQALVSTADVVLGPAFDGGCWSIGQARAHGDWLSDVAWSTHTVCATLVQRARDRGLSIDLLPYWPDVDDPSDLRRLQQQLRILPENTAPHSRAWLAQHPESQWHT